MKALSSPQHPGFSLIELLIVIAVITVLAALAFPIFRNIQQTSNTAKCLSNMRQVGVGMHGYMAENNMFFPTQKNGSAQTGVAGSCMEAIAPYLGWDRPLVASANAAKNSIMHCPEHKKEPGSFSYRFSSFLISDPRGLQPNTHFADGPVAMANLLAPDRKVVAWEIHVNCQWPLTSHYNVGTGKSPYMPLFDRKVFTHPNGINYLFADGHVETIDDKLSDYKYWQFNQP